MSRRLILLLGCALLLVPTVTVHAQAVPQAVYDALADLSQRAWTTLTLNDLARWEWNQYTYPDASLGCPQPGQNYAQTVTNGYRIVFVYNGATFDYRAPVSGGPVIFCSGPALTTTTITASPTPAAPEAPTGGNLVPSAPTTVSNTDTSTVPDTIQTYLALNTAATPITAATVGQLARYVEIPVFQPVTGIAWSPDLVTLAATELNGIWLYNLNALNIAPRFFQLPNGPVNAVTFSSDQVMMATAHTDTTVRLWDMSTGGQRAVLRGHNQPVLAVAFSPDGTRLASAGADGMVLLWDVATQTQIAALQGHTGPVTTLAFAPNGMILASGSEDTTVRLWDVMTAAPGTVLSGHPSAVRSVVFDTLGGLLISAGDDALVRVTNIASGEQITVEGHTGPVAAVAVSPDGSLLISAGSTLSGEGDNRLVFWDITATESIGSLESYGAPPGARIAGLTFNSTGTLLAFVTVQGDASVIRLWGVQP